MTPDASTANLRDGQVVAVNWEARRRFCRCKIRFWIWSDGIRSAPLRALTVRSRAFRLSGCSGSPSARRSSEPAALSDRGAGWVRWTAMSTGHATDAEEEYLQALFWLQEAELPMTGANVAKAMQLAPPTVHEMIGRLVEDGYIAREPDKSLRFTDDGRRHAEAIVTRHRLIERFLTDVLGIPWDEVHEEGLGAAAGGAQDADAPDEEAHALADDRRDAARVLARPVALEDARRAERRRALLAEELDGERHGRGCVHHDQHLGGEARRLPVPQEGEQRRGVGRRMLPQPRKRELADAVGRIPEQLEQDRRGPARRQRGEGLEGERRDLGAVGMGRAAMAST